VLPIDQRDVVVVGAGPAGSTAARLLTSCGWSVTLVQAEVGPVPLTGLLTGLSLLVARHALVADNGQQCT
jgi:flavin-dependent dehydrogenase